MRTTTVEQWCTHCDLEQTRRRNGLCGACNAYQHKYGQLPSEHVVARRLHRREQRRLEQLAGHRDLQAPRTRA